MGIKKWSKTAGSNDSISSSAGTINWKEGMPPSAVNDSARVTMADVRDWYEDAQWINLGDADGTTSPRRATNEISLSGTHTLTYHVGRRLKALDTSGNFKYGTITGTTFSGGTQITLSLDSGSLTGSVSQVWLGALTATNHAVPSTVARLAATQTWTGVQTFSSGIVFANETLSTYDEVTWTPEITFGGASVGLTYTERAGRAVKIGKLVQVAAGIVLSAKGSSTGATKITGLPFTRVTDSITVFPLAAQYGVVNLTAGGSPIAVVGSNATTITLNENLDTAQPNAILDSQVANNSNFAIGGTYEAAS